MIVFCKHIFALIAFVFACSPVWATDCSQWKMFATTAKYLEPLSVPASKLQNHLNASSWSDGVIVDVAMNERELWMDIVYFPGETQAAAAVRIAFQVGRLTDEDFDKFVMAEDGRGVFSIDEPALREIGCQFIWGKEGGQNPIALMRHFFKELKRYETGAPVFSGFTGSLLGDTTLALDVHNSFFVPEWVMSSVE